MNAVAGKQVMNAQQVYQYYSNDFIVEQMLRNSRNREIAGALRDGGYDQRPNILVYKSDIIAMVRKGVTSFHFSVERWRNPMQLSAAKADYSNLRTGWDLLIDLDSKLGIDAAKTAALHVCSFLEGYGIAHYGIKFSGSRGFHICVPWEAFPKEVNYKPLSRAYPKAPRIIARFIRRSIADRLMKELIRQKTAKEMLEALGEAPASMNPFYFVELEKDWGARHMARAPFSLNEKTWLASVTLSRGELEKFSPEQAEPFFVITKNKSYPEFFAAEENEAERLLLEALDWYAARKKEKPKKPAQRPRYEKRIAEEHFPPCMKNILAGLADGKKRSLFTLVNFLRLMNWRHEEIEERMLKWNEKNKPPLPRSAVLAAIRYQHQNPHTTANCFNDQFYVSFGVCQPDALCRKMNAARTSNPLAYPFKKLRTSKPAMRGFACMCGKEFRTARSLAIHKAKTH